MLTLRYGFMAILLTWLSLNTSVQADAAPADTYHCQSYVERALEQNRQNKQFACGYSGLRWNDDRAGQYQWCLSTRPAISNAEDDARSKLLTQCFTNKTSPDNPQNRPAIPQACMDSSRKYKPVKNIYAGFRYESSISSPVANGLIRYDYNQDKKDDFVFLELNGDMAHLSVCLSQPQGYQRKQSGIQFYAEGGTTSAEQYSFSQKKDLLQIHIDFFAHNEGSASRSTAYRYNINTQAFDIIENTADSSPVEYDGQPYPMSAPQTPDMTLR